jgi:soluble lytic murein transglycosylase-like protein
MRGGLATVLLLAMAALTMPACNGGRIDAQPTGPSDGPTATSADGSVPPGASTGHTLGPGANANLHTFAPFIEDASTQTNVPADLIASVIWRESRANPTVGGGGLMQVDPQAFARMQSEYPDMTGDLSDPHTAILAGAYYLVDMQADLQAKYGRNDWGITLRAYNSGINGVDPQDLNSIPAGTGVADYVTSIFSYWVTVSTGQGSLPP